jgi:malonyl-CoA/methylmalonyl-CoA synthetase
MTETGMNTSNPLHGERRAGTVGLPLPADGGGSPDYDAGPLRPAGCACEGVGGRTG